MAIIKKKSSSPSKASKDPQEDDASFGLFSFATQDQEKQSRAEDRQRLVDMHNRHFKGPERPQWSSDRMLELLDASDARSHGMLYIRGMLAQRMRSALSASPALSEDAKKEFIHTLAQEVSLKTVTQDTAIPIRHAALGRFFYR